MSELYVLPDVESEVVQYLAASLVSRDVTATVATKVPKVRPATMVRVSGLGGSRRNVLVDESGVLIECWAAREDYASDLARLVRALIDDLDTAVDGGWIESKGTSVPVYFPEPDVAEPRFQFTAQLLIQGEALA